MNDTELQFLKESNAIEGVYDELSLIDAQEAWEYLKSQEKLDVDVMLRTHFILMKNQDLAKKHIGQFRDCDVSVGGMLKLKVYEIRPAVESWLEEVETDVLGMRLLWKQRHVEYENIHPFIDGNGRTGRMFMNWQRLKQGLPILVITEEGKYDYYKWFI